MPVDVDDFSPSPVHHDNDFAMHSDNESDVFTSNDGLLHDRSRWNSNGHREKQCGTCGDWIDLGKGKSGETALRKHEGKRRCLAKVESNRVKLEAEAASAALEDLRQSVSLSPQTPYHPRGVGSHPSIPLGSPFSLTSPTL